MAYTTVNKSTDYFNTKLYSGTGSSQNITGVGFQPDWTWVKSRTNAEAHVLRDAVRGNYRLNSASNGAQDDATSSISGFVSDGFTVATADAVNNASQTYTSWNWKANGQGSSNTDGSINTTYTSVNTTVGFSISTYTGTGSNATVGHGLGVAPKMIFIKRLSANDNWIVYHNAIGATKNLYLDATNAEDTRSDTFNNTAPTSSVFSLGSATGTNGSGQTYVAYCFADVPGYSKIGSFTGNGNANGTFIYTGFKPAFILVRASNLVTNWHLYDNKRDPINPADIILRANSSNAEATNSEFAYDFVSNGFKARSSGSEFNGSGNTFIYYAVGQSLVGSNNIPATAR